MITSEHLKRYVEEHAISPKLLASFLNVPIAQVRKWLAGERISDADQDMIYQRLNIRTGADK